MFLAYLSGIETGNSDNQDPGVLKFLAYLSGIETRTTGIYNGETWKVFSVPIRN